MPYINGQRVNLVEVQLVERVESHKHNLVGRHIHQTLLRRANALRHCRSRVGREVAETQRQLSTKPVAEVGKVLMIATRNTKHRTYNTTVGHDAKLDAGL